MILSKRCMYGIQAAIYIASQPAREYIQIHVISQKLNVPFHFLTKVLQQLTQAGLMTSYRGPNGGIMLARDRAEIRLYDIISAIDGTSIFSQCVLGLPGCSVSRPCPAHESWRKVQSHFELTAKTTTLELLADRAEELVAEAARITGQHNNTAAS